MARHIWTKNDDIFVFYVTKFGDQNLDISEQEFGDRVIDNYNSLKMRKNNFLAIMGKGGLEHFAKLSSEVYKEFQDLSEPQLRKVANGVLHKLDLRW